MICFSFFLCWFKLKLVITRLNWMKDHDGSCLDHGSSKIFHRDGGFHLGELFPETRPPKTSTATAASAVTLSARKAPTIRVRNRSDLREGTNDVQSIVISLFIFSAGRSTLICWGRSFIPTRAHAFMQVVSALFISYCDTSTRITTQRARPAPDFFIFAENALIS
jgi:hypothetical protein